MTIRMISIPICDEIHIDDLRDLDPVTIDMFGDIEMVVRIGSLINIVTNIINTYPPKVFNQVLLLKAQPT